MSVLTDLRARRADLVASLEAVTRPAADAKRHFTADEDERWTALNADLKDLDTRIAAITEGEQRGQAAEAAYRDLMARPADHPTATSLSAANKDLDQAFRSAILEKNPAPIDVRPEGGRSWSQPGLEYRDLTKGTATQALPVSVFNRIVMHMLESSAVMAAGATVITTESGETLQVPKSTGFSTSAIVAEAAAITESDPTLAKVDLGAYKYGTFFQVSHELAKDGSADLLGFLARQAGQSIALAFGPHLITGTGSGQPRGIVTDATTGVTGPTGTSTSFGTQATAGQGTDLLSDLYSSLAEPYTRSESVGWLLRTATLGSVRKLKASTGELVGATFAGPPSVPGAQATILGAPAFVDPSVAAMGVSTKSVIFGDLSKYFIRIAGGLRFESTEAFAFQNDLISFRCLLRLDAATVDLSALKVFVHSAT